MADPFVDDTDLAMVEDLMHPRTTQINAGRDCANRDTRLMRCANSLVSSPNSRDRCVRGLDDFLDVMVLRDHFASLGREAGEHGAAVNLVLHGVPFGWCVHV